MWFSINTELKYNYERRMRLKNNGNTDKGFNGSFYVGDLATRALWDRLILFNM